ncbi:hypothetical protein J4208_00115 [Candidatus Woesearchaeota archaeon]|nr:hypothetical protein [Candidatus Woesearchaeota archaeon]
MFPAKGPKYIFMLEESMRYVDAEGNKTRNEDHRYTHAHELVREILCKSQPFTGIVTGYEPKGRRALVCCSRALDEQVREELKARTKGIVARIELNGAVRK